MERKGIEQQSSLVLDRTLDCGFGLTDLAKGQQKVKAGARAGEPNRVGA